MFWLLRFSEIRHIEIVLIEQAVKIGPILAGDFRCIAHVTIRYLQKTDKITLFESILGFPQGLYYRFAR